jgi:2-polyprenyl-3-methyl-5-hydroxy-6-metoxy-1,4-benzoquinol methylase
MVNPNALIIEQLKNLYTEIAEVKRLLQKFGHDISPESAMTKRDELGIAQEKTSYLNMISYDTVKDIILSPNYPLALNTDGVLDPTNENDKVERGEAILEGLITDNIIQKKFLDYGCGEGYCTLAASRKGAALSVGYDKVQYDTWKRMNFPTRFFCTQNWQQVQSHNPYDYILMYDVLDHIHDGTQVAALNYCSSVLAPGGKIFVRCHPYFGRTGAHQVQDLNKAFVHVVLTDEELRKIAPNAKHIHTGNRWIDPEGKYEEFFAKARLKVVSKNVTRDLVEDFFKTNETISERIIQNTKSTQFPESTLSINFVDYVLERA